MVVAEHACEDVAPFADEPLVASSVRFRRAVVVAYQAFDASEDAALNSFPYEDMAAELSWQGSSLEGHRQGVAAHEEVAAVLQAVGSVASAAEVVSYILLLDSISNTVRIIPSRPR